MDRYSHYSITVTTSPTGSVDDDINWDLHLNEDFDCSYEWHPILHEWSSDSDIDDSEFPCWFGSSDDNREPGSPTITPPRSPDRKSTPSVSSPPARRRLYKCDVFLSFRGTDTRSTFVSHLYAALDRSGIVTFKDDKRLDKGSSISPQLLKAIEDSKVALVILSPDYGSSPWCLDELLKIMECRQDMGQVVFPVFYHLRPSEVRNNFIKRKTTSKFVQATTEHEEVYLDSEEQVRSWRYALKEVATLSGFVLQPGMDEANVISSIVRATAKHILYTSSNVDKGFVGMDSRVDDLLHNYMCPWLPELENLAGSCDWFGPGSRIIITTSDVHLLKAHGVDTIYTATRLNYDEALQLLSLKAFKNSHPPGSYLKMCNHIFGYAQGLPLALSVIGSFLFGRNTNEWRSTIDRLKSKREKSIIDVLRISFDELRDTEKEIFLHIACFFKGKDRVRVTQILDYCELYPDIGLTVLADKSLITISNEKLLMHDLLQELGWEIVYLECPNHPGKRSRLWSHEDINTVLKKNKGTKKILGMVMESTRSEMVQWNPEAFSNLSELIILQISNVNLSKGLTCLPNSLRLLEWNRYPFSSLPQNFEADELIELNLCNSNIEQLWEGTKIMDKLKFIKLSHSQNFIQTPDLSGVYNLESLDLEGCKNLVRLHESIGVHRRLVFLNLKDCESLQSLPGKLKMNLLKFLSFLAAQKSSKFQNLLETWSTYLCFVLMELLLRNYPCQLNA